jgi:hypothetical protein
LVWHLARRLRPSHAPAAAVAYGWNPLLLLDFAMNGHNDVLMLTSALGALLLTSRERAGLGALSLGVSIATKYTSVLLAPLLLVWRARREERRGARVRVLALLSALVAAPLLLGYLPWIQGVETLGPVLYWVTGPRLQSFWPEPALIALAGWLSWAAGTSYETAWEMVFDGFKLAAKAGLVALILWEAWRARKMEDVLGAGARISLFFLLLVNTWVMPWYYSWPLAYCAALGWQSLLVRVCAGFTLAASLLMYQRQYGYFLAGEWGGLFLVSPLVLAAVPLLAQLRRTRGLPILGRLVGRRETV